MTTEIQANNIVNEVNLSKEFVSSIPKTFIPVLKQLFQNPDYNPFLNKSLEEIADLNKSGIFDNSVDIETDIPIIVINTTDRKDFRATAPQIWDFSENKRLKGTSEDSVIFTYVRNTQKAIVMTEAKPDAMFYIITPNHDWINEYIQYFYETRRFCLPNVVADFIEKL